MSLAPGTRIGPYEIMGALGAGGMGEVYRARDTKLNRDVALKILSGAVATDPERLARFRREAQTLASLNHQNIAHLYGFEDAGATHALVMELVDGPTLSDHIARGPIALAEALPIVRQIADALEAAHDHGVIHRDLKPANIKVRSDGTVKVLDFGLAKALAGDGSGTSSDPTLSPTMTARATEVGMILGTAAYMSPEQAKGKAVDRRADIWAFGVVLFEMLTGRQVFTGETTTEVMASVMKEEPEWSRLPSNLPSSIVRLLHRCLEKDPRKRLSAIGDARFDLDETDAGARATSVTSRGWSSSRVALVALGALLTGGIAAWVLGAGLHTAPEAGVTRSTMLPPAGTTVLNDSSAVAISPDGRSVAFITGESLGAVTKLWIRRLDALAAKEVDGGQGAFQPFWSPDSREVAFFTKDKLKKVAADGGRVEEICDAQDARGGTWSTTNVIVFAPSNAGPLLRVPASGGTPQPATSLDASRGETGHRFPAFLPDGDRFLYAAMPAHAGAFDILIGSLSGGKGEPLMKAESAPVFSAGYLFFDRKGGLVAQRFDPGRRVLTGDPVALDDAPGLVSSLFFGSAAATASASGTLAYVAAPPVNTSLVWFDVSGRQIGKVAVPPGTYTQVAVAPDARHAIASRSMTPTTADLWMIDLERGGASKFSATAGTNFFPTWSPDGERVAFATDRNGLEEIVVKPASGSGAEEVLYQSATLFKQPVSWSRDGRYVVFRQINPVSGDDLWVIPVDGDRKAAAYAQSPAAEDFGAISPDGKWMAYTSDETGRAEAYVQSFPTPGRKFRISTDGAVQVWWRKDSRQVLMLNTDATELLTVDVLPGPDFSTAPPKVVGHLPKGVGSLDVTWDLQRVLGLVTEGGNVTLTVTLVQHWTDAARK